MNARPPLPIDDILDALRAGLEGSSNAVLVAEPGAGKTTRVPLALREALWLKGRKIMMLEPRRVAARAAARFMAHGLGEEVGDTVGYRVRFDSRVSAKKRVEIVTEGPYDYDARYNPGRVEYFTPARLAEDLTAAVGEAAVAAHRALGLERISRTDLIVDESGTPWFLEVNVAPGMTETSLLPQAAEGAGHNLGDLYRSLVLASLA